jgi:RES domain
MTALDPSPKDFSKLILVTTEVEPSSLLRLASTKHLSSDPFRRDRQYRFDAPDESFGVLYAAFDLETAFVESIVRDKAHPLPAGEHLFIDYETLASRYIAMLSRSSSGGVLRLAQLYGAGLSAVKADNRLATVDDYATTQQWAKAFHAHPGNIDGIVYMSRYLGNRRSVVIFDRARGAIRFNNSLPLLHHAELARLLDTYHVSLVLLAAKKTKKTKNKKRRKKKRKRGAR